MSATTAPTAEQVRTVERSGAVGTWTVATADSSVGFAVKNFWGLATVRGGFARSTGTAEVGADGRVSGALSLEVASLDTKQAKRDEHLRGDDFFAVEQFPTIDVRIDRVELRSADRGVASGVVVARGETVPVSFEVAIDLADDAASATVTGSVTIDRSRFGIDWRPMRMAALDVLVSFDLTFRRSAS